MAATTTIIAVAAVAAALASAGAAVAQGQAQAKASRFNAKVAENQAISERQRSAADAEAFRRRQSRMQATILTRQAGSNVDIGTGTPLLTAEDFAGTSEYSALNILAGGDARAATLESQAKLDRFRATTASRAGFAKAGTSILSGASTAAGANWGAPDRISVDPGLVAGDEAFGSFA
jgi:hypothetical protein